MRLAFEVKPYCVLYLSLRYKAFIPPFSKKKKNVVNTFLRSSGINSEDSGSPVAHSYGW